MAKILVTGCAGFIASHLCDTLIEAGHEVIGIDNLSTGKRENINPQVLFFEVDIRDFQPVNRLVSRVDYVYHLAALARIQPSIDNPVEANSVNVTGTLNVLEACRRNNVKRVIFSSSSSIYEGSELPTNEDSVLDLKNPYSLQKDIAEQYIELYRRLYGLDYVIFRYFNVYGPRQILDGAYAAVVGIFLKQQKEGLSLTINGDGTKRRDFTHVYDVTRANVMALELPTGIYNVGTGMNYSIQQLADAISPHQVYRPDAPGEALTTQADNMKLISYGWYTTRDILNPDVLEEMDKCVS